MTKLNKVLIQGHFGAEPEITKLDEDRRVAKFRVAVDTGYKDASGEWVKRADWFRVVTFVDRFIDNLERANKLTGSMVYVDGRLRERTWEKDGEKRSAVEVEAGPYGDIKVLAS